VLRCGSDSAGLGLSSLAGIFEKGNERLGSVKAGNILIT
jgi:hypothetical protein